MRISLPKYVAAVAVGATVLALATPAFAHVGFTDGEASAGTAAQLTLRVPEEAEAAGEFTSEVKLVLPEGVSLGTVTASEVAGWTTAVAADSVTWTTTTNAAGGPYMLPVSFSQVPTATGRLQFKALQTYNTGRVVRWIDPVPPGAEEPEFPGPFLDVVAGATQSAAPDDDEADHAESTSASDSTTASSSEATESSAATESTTVDSDYGSIAPADESADDKGDGKFPVLPVVGAVLVLGGLALAFGARRKK